MFESLAPLCTLVVLSQVTAFPSDIKYAGLKSSTPKSGEQAPSKSQTMCAKYAESVFTYEKPPTFSTDSQLDKVDNCAITVKELIIGGSKANPKEFPHMAFIGYGDGGPNTAWFCAGSLISERFILSAAHCSTSERGRARWARLGDLIVFEKEDDENYDAEPITIEIIEHIVHPNYRAPLIYNDIMLFKLKDEVSFTPFIRPICLHTSQNVTQERALTSGWGRTSWGGLPTKYLMKVILPLRGEACKESYADRRKVARGYDNETMICAGGEEGKDTCQGDSGGPLQIVLRSPYCMYAQIGITSYGIGCASTTPGIYTKVSHFVPWIEKIVWP